MPGFKNHEVWIESDGNRYEEYAVQVQGNVVTCWIESQVDRVFSIKWKNHSALLEISIRIIVDVDGNQAQTVVFDHAKRRAKGTLRGHRVDDKTEKPYLFSRLEFTDDENILNLIHEDLGSIVVKIYRVVITGQTDNWQFTDTVQNIDIPMNERAKKIGPHKVRFSEDTIVSTKSCGAVYTKDYDDDQSPFVTYRFNYRPLDILRAQDIIPLVTQSHGKHPRKFSACPSFERQKKRSKRPANNLGTEEEAESILSDVDKDIDGIVRQLEEQQVKVQKQQAEIARKLDDVVRQLGEQQAEVQNRQAEITRNLEVLRGQKRGKVKKEVKLEGGAGQSELLVMDENGAIDLTLDD